MFQFLFCYCCWYSCGNNKFSVGLKIYVIRIKIKKYKLTITKKRGGGDEKIVLIAKTKLYSIEILISKALIDSYISHGETISINNVLQEYDEKKK